MERDMLKSPYLARTQQGLSLVELMVASFLSILIVLALTKMFVDVTRANSEMAKTNSQIENARFAMQFLRNDIVHAGYWGGYLPAFDDLSYVDAPLDYPDDVPDPCIGHDAWDTDSSGVIDIDDDQVKGVLAVPVQVFDTPPAGCGAVIKDHVVGTDILVVRHAETCVVGEGNCDAVVDPNELYFNVSNCDSQIEDGKLFTLDPNSPAANPLHADFPKEINCTTNVAFRKYVQNIYYVRDYAFDNSGSGDGIPTLVRSQFGYDGSTLGQQPAQALVEGIERLRIELSLDTLSETGDAIEPASTIRWTDPDIRYAAENRGDGIPDAVPLTSPPEMVKHCGAACTDIDELSNVVGVKIHLLARATLSSPGYTDTKTYTLGTGAGFQISSPSDFKRHVFSTSMRLNNISGRRETP